MAILATNAVQIARFANGLYGIQLGSATNAAVLADITAAGGLDNALNSYYTSSFGTKTSAQVAAIMVANLGIVAGQNGLTAAAVTDATNYIVATLNAATASTKGVAVKNILNLWANIADDANLSATYGAAATAWDAQVAAAQLYTASNTADISITAGAAIGQTFTLTTGADYGASFTGGAGNDTFNATDATLSALDAINGGAGANVLNYTDTTGSATLPTAVSVQNVQTMNVISAGEVGADAQHRFDVSPLTSVTTLNVTRSYDNNYIEVGDGQAVNVSGTATGRAVDVVATTGAVSITATGAVTVDGGSTQTVAAKGGVNLTGATGAVVATDSAQAGNFSTITHGTNVSLTTSVALANGTGGIQIGEWHQGAVNLTKAPTGAVTVAQTITGDKTANAAANSIEVDGGSSVSVTQSATQAIATPSTTAGATTTNYTATQAAVYVDGSDKTTSVTVKQTAPVAKVDTVTAQAGVKQVDTVTFIALTSGESVTVGGLTFTAAKSLTATEVATAFAGLASGATHGSSAASNGVYSGTFGSYTTGPVTTSGTAKTVDATKTTAATGHTAIVVSDTAAANISSANKTAGVTAVAAVTGVGGIGAGAVAIWDYNGGDATKAGVITTATVDGYAAGYNYIDSNALTTLSLANSAEDSQMWIGVKSAAPSAAKTLNLTVNKLATGSLVSLEDLDASYTTLNLTATGADSTAAILASSVTALSINGDKKVDLTVSGNAANNNSDNYRNHATLDTDFTALKTVVISGSASVVAGTAFAGTAVTDVNASATSGTVSASIDASKATYEGASGADTITLTSSTVSKAVSLGDGNDTVTLASGTTSLTANVSGGDGTDTLVIAAADAATASATTAFSSKIDGFEKLSLGQVAAAATKTVDLTNLDGISYVISSNVSTGSAAPVAIVSTIDSTQNSPEIAQVTVPDLLAGESLTIDGVTVTATADTAASDVLMAFFASGFSVATLTASGTRAFDWYATSASGTTLNFEAQTAGNVPDFTYTSTGLSAGSLTLSHMANNGTLELTAAGAGATVTMTDATGTSDSLNIVTKVNASNLDFGTVTAAGVETVNITATDTTATSISKATLTVSDTAAKTVVITGNSDLDLTAAGSELTTVNASAATGKLNFSSAVNSVSITGGAAADSLTASGNNVTINGGAGNDTLVVTGNLATLTGGAGNDIFNVSDATTNVNSYATITDLTAGDAIKFNSNSTGFAAARVTLGDTAVFQDFANAAIANSAQYAVSWFQYNGNTYVVQDVSNSTTTFTNGVDLIVKIAGLVDLSTATFNTTTDSLYI